MRGMFHSAPLYAAVCTKTVKKCNRQQTKTDEAKKKYEAKIILKQHDLKSSYLVDSP